MKAIKLFLFKMWYGLPFEKGYTYKQMGAPNSELMQRMDVLMIKGGWERFSEPDTSLNGNIYCWYKIN